MGNNFNAIYRVLANEERLKVHCSDKTETECYPLSMTIAFVKAADPFDVYVCPRYWTAPPLGIDSQASTFVHEVSHFDIVADTSDFPISCADLALSDPARAIADADCYENFANTFTP